MNIWQRLQSCQRLPGIFFSKHSPAPCISFSLLRVLQGVCPSFLLVSFSAAVCTVAQILMSQRKLRADWWDRSKGQDGCRCRGKRKQPQEKECDSECMAGSVALTSRGWLLNKCWWSPLGKKHIHHTPLLTFIITMVQDSSWSRGVLWSYLVVLFLDLQGHFATGRNFLIKYWPTYWDLEWIQRKARL